MNENKDSNLIKLNEQALTLEEFAARKEQLESKEGVTVVELKQGEYKSRLHD